jgi:hypothetical protein
VLKRLGDHGTMVRLTKVDRADDTNVARFAATLRTRFAETYRDFIRGVGPVGQREASEAVDPLMRDHPETRSCSTRN